MRLLIAGWQGQIARGLVEAAPGCADVKACAVGRAALDICEARSIERALSQIEPSIVINSAAYTAVDKAETDEERAFALNRDGARLLAEAAARRGIPIIHISTDYVFDGRKAAPYVEDDPPAPVTVFGRSKLEGETSVRAANPKHVILRTAWVYSPSGRNFVKTMLEQAGVRDRVRVVDDQRGSPTYAPHLVAAILDVARQLSGRKSAEGPWGVYHAAGTGTTTWRGVAAEGFLQPRSSRSRARTTRRPPRARPTRSSTAPSSSARSGCGCRRGSRAWPSVLSGSCGDSGPGQLPESESQRLIRRAP